MLHSGRGSSLVPLVLTYLWALKSHICIFSEIAISPSVIIFDKFLKSLISPVHVEFKIRSI